MPQVRIALAGNPNSGKTTLFNALTGANQFVGNWPGVTVEKKEGKLKKHEDVIITDLPGIYSLSPYTPEEIIARGYLIDERPDAILNIVDGTNLERNLYLTTQLLELGIPVVVAVNMMDAVRKAGDKVNTAKLSEALDCPVVEISALKGENITQAAAEALKAAQTGGGQAYRRFSKTAEEALSQIEELLPESVEEPKRRYYAIKFFERDEKITKDFKIEDSAAKQIEEVIARAEEALDDDSESIITNERYECVAGLLKGVAKKKNAGALTLSDKIDRVVTNRFLALPIFAVIMILVYYVSVSTVGSWATDWANDGVFGDGFHLFGISGNLDEETDAWAQENVFTPAVGEVLESAAAAGTVKGSEDLLEAYNAQDFGAFEEAYGTYHDEFYKDEVFELDGALGAALDEEGAFTSPDPAEYGVWVPGIPVLIERGLDAIHCAPWLESLILDGIVGGVGAVLGFLPQMFILFVFLGILEACGYMARVAFVMDRIFRRFGLSGKSFIPMLIGSGCGVPGVMASRTIENERDRRMTIMTTTFIPCGAKLPIIALIASALFDGAWWVAPSAYFVGVAAIVISGIILKKTKIFSGDPAPFVMELPAYHLPTVGNVWRSVWERLSSFIRKAGTIILLSSIVIWAGSSFGTVDGSFGFYTDMALEDSVLGMIGSALRWIFVPLGFGSVKAVVATLMGLVAKEEVVGVFGILDFEGLTPLSGYCFLLFNLLCAPCFAAMGAIRREMNSGKWTAFAIGYQCVFAYCVSLVVYQFGMLFSGSGNVLGVIAATVILALACWLLFRPDPQKRAAKKAAAAAETA